MIIAFLTTAVLAGPLDDTGVEPAPPPIVNGQTETDYPSAVALGAFNFSACTGSLITPRIVLSAAHCGGDYSPESIVAIGQAYFGDTPATADITVGFESWTAHPDYVPLGETWPQTPSENDVGIVVLDADVDIDPVWFRTHSFDDDDVGTEVTSVGFGATNGNGGGGGTKRSAVLTIDRVEDEVLWSDNDTNANNANICSGDSGGPMYHEDEDGNLVQWAVHSWGDNACSEFSGSTRTDIVEDFILEHVENVHGTTDFCEITGMYGDGLCTESCLDDTADCEEIERAERRANCACSASDGPGGMAWLLAVLPLIARRRRQR